MYSRASTVLRRAAFSTSASPWGTGQRTLTAIDCHCEGEPARIVTGGVPAVHGETMYEKVRFELQRLHVV
jgi:hypothetical protein